MSDDISVPMTAMKWPLAAQFMTMPMAVLILAGAAVWTAVLWWKGRGR